MYVILLRSYKRSKVSNEVITSRQWIFNQCDSGWSESYHDYTNAVWSGWYLADVGVRTEVEVEWKSVYRKVRFASFGWLLRARPKCTMTVRRGDIIHYAKLILCTQKAKPKKVDPRRFLLQFIQLRSWYLREEWWKMWKIQAGDGVNYETSNYRKSGPSPVRQRKKYMATEKWPVGNEAWTYQ